MSPFQKINLLRLVIYLYKNTETNLGVLWLFVLMLNHQRRTIKIENPSDIEILTIDITIRKNKILVAGMRKSPNHSETVFYC